MKDRGFEKLGPNDLVEIVVKQTLKIEKRFIEGDTDGNVSFEVVDKDEMIDPYERQILLRGGRVFYTENDMPLIIHSEESLKFKEENVHKAVANTEILDAH